MKRTLKWATIGGSIGFCVYWTMRSAQRARHELQKGLERAEAITDHTRAAVEEVQQAIHETRAAI